jgi:hypothetical protein
MSTFHAARCKVYFEMHLKRYASLARIGRFALSKWYTRTVRPDVRVTTTFLGCLSDVQEEA